jgi:V/A-type H+-transporting ATPase subunit F
VEKIAVISPPDARYGFSLGGISQSVVEPGDAEKALSRIMAGPGYGLVMIDERLLKEMPEERLRELERGWHGILLVLPSPETPPAGFEDYAARLIRRAIGYHVRLKL